MNNTSIGIRVKPDCIIYSIIKENDGNKDIILIDKVNVPIALEVESKADDCEFFDDWSEYNKEEKESLLAALSAFNL